MSRGYRRARRHRERTEATRRKELTPARLNRRAKYRSCTGVFAFLLHPGDPFRLKIWLPVCVTPFRPVEWMRDPNLSYASLENHDFGIQPHKHHHHTPQGPSFGPRRTSADTCVRILCSAGSAVRRGVGSTRRRLCADNSSQFLEALEFWSPPKELRCKFRAEERIPPRFCADNDLIP